MTQKRQHSTTRIRNLVFEEIEHTTGLLLVGTFGPAEHSQNLTEIIRARALENREEDDYLSKLANLAWGEPHNGKVTIWGFEPVLSPSVADVTLSTARSFSGCALKISDLPIDKSSVIDFGIKLLPRTQQ